MEKIRFYHLSLSVSSLEAMSRWYSKFVGFVPVTHRLTFSDNTDYCFMELENMKLELVEDKRSKPFSREGVPNHTLLMGVTHFSFLVENVERTTAFLKEEGVEVLIDCFVVDAIKNKVTIVRDPDDNLVEFVEKLR